LIRFEQPPKPERFHAGVEVPGARWLADHPDAKRPYDYWTAFKSELADGFRNLCAYSAMYEPVGTVDHFESWDKDRSRAYDWSNYRYAAGWINSSKKTIPASQILDPFEVGDDWFSIILPSLQLVVSEAIPDEFIDRAEFVLKRLHLRDDERVLRQRREWYRMYQEGGLSLKELWLKAPLIAAAVARDANSSSYTGPLAS
jgi:hypothetical protein